jgi:hypothetical protein
MTVILRPFFLIGLDQIPRTGVNLSLDLTNTFLVIFLYNQAYS